MAQKIVDKFQNVHDFESTSQRRNVDADLLFFSTIDEATKTWLNALHDMWTLWKKCTGITKTLTDYFDTAPNPYLSTLRILVNTSDFKYCKTRSSLAFTVAEQFSNWLQERKDAYKECLVPDLKIAAFKLVSKQKNMQLIRMISVIYEFMEHKELFLQLIKTMIYERKYKEAAQYATMLQLQFYFSDPEILLLPLILQNKLPVMEEFLNGCPCAQEALIMYLDHLVAPEINLQNTLDAYIIENKISDVNLSITQIRPMTKLIARLVKLYNLSSELCPNLNQRRSGGALQFLMHKRYIDGSLSMESWREMVREAVGNNPKLQLDVIKMLVQANDAQESLYWAKAYNIPKAQWPCEISYLDEWTANNVNDGASTSKEENWDTEENSINYHTLNLSRDCIRLVDNSRTFAEFLDHGLKGVSVVGIDSEWKPSFGTKRTELALIQIATERNVYILDVTTMGSQFMQLWGELGLTLFENKSILKLGFGIANDIGIIRDSLPALSKIKAHGQGYLDMLNLWKKLVQEYEFVFPYKGDETFTNESLSKLVELCLGQRLNKSDQFSNWERRPLRESQITYAALDAYCLLEIYDTLASQCAQMDIPFQEICAEIEHISHKSPKKSTKKLIPKTNSAYYRSDSYARNQHGKYNGMQRYGYSQNYRSFPKQVTLNGQENKQRTENEQHICDNPMPAHKWRVVCDSMLGGLATKLRMCGCDCVYMSDDKGTDRSVKLAMGEDRVLLTRNKECERTQLFQYLPDSNYYLVTSNTPNQQLQEVINHFNILVSRKDIFS